MAALDADHPTTMITGFLVLGVSTVVFASGAGAVRNMTYDARFDVIWFGTDKGTLGRAKVE